MLWVELLFEDSPFVSIIWEVFCCWPGGICLAVLTFFYFPATPLCFQSTLHHACRGTWLLKFLGAWGYLVVLPAWVSSTKVSSLIERISDPKDLKKLLRTRNNVLVLYSKSEAAAESHLKLLSTVAQAVKGQGTICWVDCGDTESRKLCKKMKVDLSPKDKKIELFHYQDGAFHMEYDRAVTLKAAVDICPDSPRCYGAGQPCRNIVGFAVSGCSMCKRVMPHFQKAATQVRGHFWGLVQSQHKWHHIDRGCGHCKKMKPEFEGAAEVLHGDAESSGVLAAVDATVNEALAGRFHISAFPTLKYFKNGEQQAVPALRTKKKFIEWMHNPEAPPPPEPTWEEQQTSVLHLTGDDFRDSLKKKKHALVMFYAPWCPHCKKVIPHFTATADAFRDDRKIACAAVDCVKDKNQDLCQQEAVKAYPTFHYYHYGKLVEKYESDRTELGFTSFIRTLREGDLKKLEKRREEL
ncbi:Pdia5 [Phodopus roborovskii]|uniref:Protein disulfide-isomerase A5 n=1 Tax=Phodopus roborovskii TaxID=109678 RepID=A0AAU9ZIF7_PHORO|nr:Pdia5 [Phodopus roborovskii]